MPTADIPNRYIPGDGPIPTTSGLMVVGEAPALEEVKQGRPLVGKSGIELWEQMYRIVKVVRDDVYVTNTFPYPLSKIEKKITDNEWIHIRQRLDIEIREVRPRVIYALGAIAVHALLPDSIDHSMETMNGLPCYYKGTNIIVVPSFHTAAAFRNSSALQYIIDACKITRECLSGRLKPVDDYAPETVITPLSTQLQNTPIALDTETLKSGSVFIVGASSVPGQASYTYADRKSDPDALQAIAFHVAKPTTLTLLHNALFDLPVLEQAGIIPSRWIDTMSMAFFLQNLPLGLKELAYRLLHMQMRTYEEVVGEYADLSAVPDQESVIRYATADPRATLEIYNIMLPLAYPRMMENLQRDMDIQPMVIEMMRRGIKIDKQVLSRLDIDLEWVNYLRYLEIEKIAKANGFNSPVKSGKYKGTFFNPNSKPQVAELLYKRMGLGKGKKINKTTTGRLSAGKKMLAKFKDEHKVVVLLNDWTETQTLRTHFINTLPKFINKNDGAVHPDMSMTRVVHSGRFACSKPNLMAIPVRNEDGRKIRNSFVAREGWTFISGDLGQIELRVLAHVSQDPKMLHVYRNGLDIHTNTAMEIFGIYDPTKLDDYLHRLPAKTSNFLVCNLGSAQALSRELTVTAGPSWTEDRAQEFLDSWFKIYEGVKSHIDRTRATINNLGYITDMFGRRENIPQVYSTDKRLVEEGLRIAMNQQIQSPAQAIIKEIMRRIWIKYGYRWVEMGCCFPVLQVHDDIIHETRLDVSGSIAKIIKNEMVSIDLLSIPITASIKIGPVWGSMSKHIEVSNGK